MINYGKKYGEIIAPTYIILFISIEWLLDGHIIPFIIFIMFFITIIGMWEKD